MDFVDLRPEYVLAALFTYFMGDWTVKKIRGYIRGENLPINPKIQEVINILKEKKGRFIEGLGEFKNNYFVFSDIVIYIKGTPNWKSGVKFGVSGTTINWLFTNKKETKILSDLITEISDARLDKERTEYLDKAKTL